MTSTPGQSSGEGEVYYSLFGQKVVIPDLRGRSPLPTTTHQHFPNRIGITSLPTELLIWIFNIVSSSGKQIPFPVNHYLYHLKGDFCDCNHAWTRVESFPAENTMFPYPLARVCQHWRQTLASQPAFWTRIVASRAAGMHTPPAALQEYLDWSRDLPIDVYIGNIGYEGRYPHERALIKEYTDILIPHLHRCRVIDYDVKYATSLPQLYIDFEIVADSLFSLQLNSQETHDPSFLWQDDPIFRHGKPKPTQDERMPWAENNHYYHEKMVLNGRNLILALELAPIMILCDQLIVQNYCHSLNAYNEQDDPIKIPQLEVILDELGGSPSLEHVTFGNVELGPVPTTGTVNITNDFDLSSISLINVDFGLIEQCSQLYSRLRSVSILIKGCSFPRSYSSLNFRLVELTDITEDDLTYFLHRWTGGELKICDSPALTDAVLAKMAVCIDGPLEPARITYLHIHNCHEFSFKALREMLLMRHKMHTSSCISLVVKVTAPRVPITAADRMSVASIPNIVQFEWAYDFSYRMEPGLDFVRGTADSAIDELPERYLHPKNPFAILTRRINAQTAAPARETRENLPVELPPLPDATDEEYNSFDDAMDIETKLEGETWDESWNDWVDAP